MFIHGPTFAGLPARRRLRRRELPQRPLHLPGNNNNDDNDDDNR